MVIIWYECEGWQVLTGNCIVSCISFHPRAGLVIGDLSTFPLG